MKVRFSNAFLVSYKIMQTQIMQKYMLLLLTIVMWCSSTFVLISYAINFRVYLSQFEVKWTDLASQNYNFHTSPLIRTERVRTSHVLHT